MATFARAHTFPSLILMLANSLTTLLATSLPAAAIETNSITCNPSCITSSSENSSNRSTGNDSNDLSEQLRSLTQSSSNDDKQKTILPGYTSSQSDNEREASAKLTARLKQDDSEHGHGGFYGTPSSSIPEVETYAMMLAGLTILALRVQRQESIPIESD